MADELNIRENVPLGPLTTFRIGGPARYFCEPAGKDELVAALKWAEEKGESVHIFGGGSNLLVNDKGVDGLVVKPGADKLNVRGVRLDCSATATLNRAAQTAKGHGLSGLEWSVGIPNATIGGSIRGNAEAFGTAMADLVETVEAYSLAKKRFFMFSNKDCDFTYRSSIFKKTGNLLIWQAVLKLSPAAAAAIDGLTAQSLKFRTSRYPRLPSAGSIFKNLVYADVVRQNPRLAAELKKSGKLKRGFLSAGWLIEEAGLKGKTIGGAKISLEHANHIVNTGKAAAEDVVILISYIKQQIRQKFGLQLTEEIVYFGF
jgi:UDP-N-acetylmuramate dehydrogenase